MYKLLYSITQLHKMLCSRAYGNSGTIDVILLVFLGKRVGLHITVRVEKNSTKYFRVACQNNGYKKRPTKFPMPMGY